MADLYDPAKRHYVHNVTSLVDFFLGFPKYISGSRQVVVNSTLSRAIFYNVTFRGLEIPLQAFTVHIDCIKCNDSVPLGMGILTIASTFCGFHCV